MRFVSTHPTMYLQILSVANNAASGGGKCAIATCTLHGNAHTLLNVLIVVQVATTTWKTAHVMLVYK